LTRAHRIIAALNARTFWINTYNITGIDHYTQLKSVYVALAPIDAPR
jgi:betaine-aldehyde dehydrogenase